MLPKGFHHTLETRQKMSATRLRLFGRAEHFCKRCNIVLQKRVTRKYCSHDCYIEHARENFRTGLRHAWNKGKDTPESTRKLLRQKMLGNTHLLGHKHTAMSRALMSSKGRGRPKSLETRRRMSDTSQHMATLGLKATMTGRHLSKEARLKISQKAIEGYRLGQRKVFCGTKIEFLDRQGRLWKMRSSWERRVAEELDRQKLTWIYEPCRLLLSTGRTYLPDFWVHEYNRYLEVKALWRENALEKVNCAIKDGHEILIISDVDEWICTQSSECRISEEVV